MKRSIPLALAVLTASCSGVATLPNPQTALPATSSQFGPNGSWMTPAAAKQDLLYVSDARGHVDVFDYPTGKRAGVLTGFQSPAGLCSDRSGNVFVVDTNALEVLEYKHGGTKPIKTLYTFGFFPFGCAVDSASGDVAVADIASATEAAGALSIFHGNELPSTYQDSAINAYFFCSYDDHGNVFVDGADVGSYHTEFAELPKGGTSFTEISLDKTIGYPGGVQWDGKYMAVQDSASRILYRFKLTGSKGKSVGSVRFTGDKSTLVHQFWIQAPSIVMPYGSTYRQVRQVGFWPYPAGGSATKTFSVKRATELVGVTVSLAKK